jgi:hypothetical protein
MVELTKNEIIKDSHPDYEEYEQSQVIIKLNKGDTLQIIANGAVMKLYTAKYSNCHINAVIQDKGDLTPPEN